MNKGDNYLWDSNYLSFYNGNKVIHNSCNMAIRNLPNMYAHGPRAWAYISVHICLICMPDMYAFGLWAYM